MEEEYSIQLSESGTHSIEIHSTINYEVVHSSPVTCKHVRTNFHNLHIATESFCLGLGKKQGSDRVTSVISRNGLKAREFTHLVTEDLYSRQ